MTPWRNTETPDDHVEDRLRVWYARNDVPPTTDDDIVAIMSALERGPHTGRGDSSAHRRAGWVVAAGLAAAAVLVLGIVTRRNLSTDAINVRFAVTIPSGEVRDVQLIGDFSNWRVPGVPLQRNRRSGQWEATLPLTPGLHHYSFLVDGQAWVTDHAAPAVGDDLLGATNAIVVSNDQ